MLHGHSSACLEPIGTQIIAKQKEDLKVISFAKRYEEIFNFSNHKPKLN